MRVPLFSCLLLLAGGLAAPAAFAQVPTSAAVAPRPTPGQAYLLLANDCSKLLHKAASLPDAQGVALLRQQAPPLQARAKPLTRAYASWLKTLPPTQLKAEEGRIMGSGFAKELEVIVGSLKAKKHSKAFAQLVYNLMEAMAENL